MAMSFCSNTYGHCSCSVPRAWGSLYWEMAVSGMGGLGDMLVERFKRGPCYCSSGRAAL